MGLTFEGIKIVGNVLVFNKNEIGAFGIQTLESSVENVSLTFDMRGAREVLLFDLCIGSSPAMPSSGRLLYLFEEPEGRRISKENQRAPRSLGRNHVAPDVCPHQRPLRKAWFEVLPEQPPWHDWQPTWSIQRTGMHCVPILVRLA